MNEIQLFDHIKFLLRENNKDTKKIVFMLVKT